MHQLGLLCLLLLSMALDAKEIPTFEGCGETIENVPDGIIDYPGTGGNYPDNGKCVWKIFLDNNDKKEVSFQRFATYNKKDYLRVKMDGTEIGKYFGDQLPPPFETSGNELYLYFRSDSKYTATGFQLTWKKMKNTEDATAEPPSDLCTVDSTPVNGSVTSPKFFMQLWLSGKYFNTKGGSNACGTPLVISDASGYNAIWTFDIHQGTSWGYIRHIVSGLYVIPDGGQWKPSELTPLVLGANRRPWGLFELDQINKRIRHINGLYVAQDNAEAYPPDGTEVLLSKTYNMTTEIIFVNPDAPHHVVSPYGNATISGDWRLFFSVQNLLVSEEFTVEVKHGYSKTESVTGTLKFAWETTTNVRFWFVEWSTTTSLKLEIQSTSSDTWTDETKISNTIWVYYGSVAIWQRVFVGEQGGHRSVYQSNIYAQTNSTEIQPPTTGYIPHTFNLI